MEPCIVPPPGASPGQTEQERRAAHRRGEPVLGGEQCLADPNASAGRLGRDTSAELIIAEVAAANRAAFDRYDAGRDAKDVSVLDEGS